MLGLWCVGGSRNPRSLSQQWPSNRSTGIIILLINIVSLSPRDRPGIVWQPTAQRHFSAQQSRSCSSRLRLPLSSRAELIQINMLIFRLRLRCPRDELSAATARRTCSDRAPARKRTVATTRLSASERGQANGRGQQEQVSIYQNTCRYMQIESHTYGTY